MDAFVSQVNQIMEELMSSTFQLLESSRVGNPDQFENLVKSREHLFDRLNKLFEANKFTDQKWKKVWNDQLAQVQNMDNEIKSSMKLQSNRSQKELRVMESQKVILLNENQVNPRGSKLEIKG